MLTALKDTTKPVTDVSFPALTVCGSGVHLNNVEKKLIQDFRDWRALHRKNKTDKEEIKKNMEEFMEERFQIKQSPAGGEQKVNILDILDMMIAPDVDASVAANGVRENEIACRQTTTGVNDNSGCCSDPNFQMAPNGFKCLYVSTDLATRQSAWDACYQMGAELATIKSSEDDAWVADQLTDSGSIWIGLDDITNEGSFVWPDGSSLPISLMEMVIV